MQQLSGHTKLKIVAGYVTLVILAAAAVVFTYREIVGLTQPDPSINTVNRKLFITGNTITNLYEAEVAGNAFVQTGQKQSFDTYIVSINRVKQNIDSLKMLTEEPAQQERLDSIQLFLHEKRENLKELMQVKRSLLTEDFYNKALASIEANKDTIREFMNVHRKNITTQDSSYIKNPKKRKGFLGLFGGKTADSVMQITISRQITVDTVNSQLADHATDTVVGILRSVWSDIQQESQRINRQISAKEYNITVKSNYISKQLQRILSEFEQEEVAGSIARVEQRQATIHRAATMITRMAVIALIVMIVFLFFILRDISRGQRYRRELETAKRYTEELLESRERMMLTVTHDIKSPLGSITGYIELLNNNAPNERQSYFLRNMKSSAEHILGLVTKLLDYAKLDSNQMTPEEINYNPAQLLNEICESFIPQAQEKGLQLSYNIHPTLHREYSGDALRLRQIVANLLSNAVKYTATGNIEVTAEKSGEELTIRIKDSGVGISKEEQELIFKEFTRLSSLSTPSVEGTGLGLAITQKLVALLGGKMGVESTPGEGSCFWVQLPLKKAGIATSTDTGEQSATLREGLRILVVDDDRLQLEMTTALLTEKGVTVDATNHPEEVVEKVNTTYYDLILTDIQMPEMDGFELARRLRNRTNVPPIIAVSARPDLKEELYREAGFAGYLNKPFTGAQLFTLVARLTGTAITVNAAANTTHWDGEGYTLKNIAEFADYDPESVRHIVEVFIAETRKHIDILQTGTDEEIQRVAHKMLPLFRQLECTEIVDHLARLETPTAPPSPEDTNALCESIHKILNAIHC